MANSTQKDVFTANFGTVANLRIIRSKKGTAMATFTLMGGEKFSRDVQTFGDVNVEKIRAIGNGRRAWVRGPISEVTRTNEKGGTYSTPVLKALFLKDITEGNAPAQDQTAEDEMTEAETSAADAEAGAEIAAPVEETAAAEAPAEEAVVEETVAAPKARKGKSKAKSGYHQPMTQEEVDANIPF